MMRGRCRGCRRCPRRGRSCRTVMQFSRLDITTMRPTAIARISPGRPRQISPHGPGHDVGRNSTLCTATRQDDRTRSRGSIIVDELAQHTMIPVPRSMAYNMAKAAIDQMARTAAIELVEERIRVNIIHPGWMDAPGEKRCRRTVAPAVKSTMESSGSARRDRPRRMIFLCDPASDYITGSTSESMAAQRCRGQPC